MATTYKTNTYTYQHASTDNVAATRLLPYNYSGRVRVLADQINTTASAIDGTASDVLYVGILPKGAMLLPGLVTFGAMGASATFTIGLVKVSDLTTVDANVITDTVDCSSAGRATTSNTDSLVATAQHQYITTEQDIVTVFAGGALFAAAKVLAVTILYVLD